jgi:hypothetical protein
LPEQEVKTANDRAKEKILKVMCSGNIKAGFPINGENHVFL